MAARSVTITCMRGDPLHVILRVRGVDLSAASLFFAVGLNADPLGRQWIIGTTSQAGGEGVRLVRVDQSEDGLPVSIFEIIATKARMAILPKGQELGDDTPLFFDLQTDKLSIGDGFSDVETTILRGPFIVKGSIND